MKTCCLCGTLVLACCVQSARGQQNAVTVQLPMFNERYVAARLLKAVAQVDYPKERFEIQILDDSTDDTTEIVRAEAEKIRAEGIQVSLIHRTDRTGLDRLALGPPQRDHGREEDRGKDGRNAGDQSITGSGE